MDDTQRDQWAARAVRKALSGMPEPAGLEGRVRSVYREGGGRRPFRQVRAGQVALALAVAAGLSAALAFGMAARQGAARSPLGPARVQVGAPASTPTATGFPAVTLPQDPSQRFLYYAPGSTAAGPDLTLYRLDWRGLSQGTLNVAAEVGAGSVGAPSTVVAVAPDGRRLLTSGGEVLDQRGAMVGRLDVTTDNGSKLWAEDDAHLCAVDDPLLGVPDATPPAAGRVDLIGLDGSDRHVVTVGRFDRRTDVEVVACNLSRDVVALVQRQPIGGIAVGYTDLWLFRLSTGTMLVHRTYANQTFIVSPDARYLAESAGAGAGQGAEVFALPAMTKVADLGAGAVPLAFSGEGSRILYRIAGSGTTPTTSRLVDWTSGQVLWQANTAKAQVTAVTDPLSDSLVLAETGATPALLFVDVTGTVRTLVEGGPYRLLFGLASLPRS